MYQLLIMAGKSPKSFVADSSLIFTIIGLSGIARRLAVQQPLERLPSIPSFTTMLFELSSISFYCLP